jgi:hypothetical protein
LVAIRLEYRVIAELGRPEVGIGWMGYVPANASFPHTALQVLNVGRLLEVLQFPQVFLVSVRGLSEGLSYYHPHLSPGYEGTPLA